MIRGCGTALLTCVLACLFIGCDEVTEEDDGGAGGSAPPAGGADGSGGGAAGADGGAAGNDGAAGADGGAAGNDGAAGADGGAAGNDGAAGADGGGVAGADGADGGGGGADGGEPPTGPDFCQEACVQDTDCLENYACRDNRCWPTTYVRCEQDQDCLAMMSGWATPCENTEACGNPAQICVTWLGGGLCATAPDEEFQLECEAFGMVETQMPEHGGEGMVTVCGQGERLWCTDNNYCSLRCLADDHCGGEYPVCNRETGLCNCVEGTCQTNASVCEDGFCRCTGDADCSTGAVDACVDGFCGCSGVATCAEQQRGHPNTEWVCEAVVVP